MDWNSGMDYWNLLKAFKGVFHSNTQFYCVRSYLLANLLIPSSPCNGPASCSLLEVVGVRGHVRI